VPIQTSIPITVFDQEAFHAVDKVVTGVAFDIHNEFGRYLDKRLYQRELASRLSGRGLVVHREMQMELTLDDFSRDYFADFLVNNGVIVETKVVGALTNAHKAQTLNYLYLCELHHGTLLNFRPERVQHRFVSTTLTTEDRRRIKWDLETWTPLTPRCEILHSTLVRALEDWGARLAPTLYRDVITHFLGGELEVVCNVEVRSEHGSLGEQRVHLVAPDVAFSVTAAVHRPDVVREHQRRFLQHTSLRAMQWINLSGQTVRLHTIHP